MTQELNTNDGHSFVYTNAFQWNSNHAIRDCSCYQANCMRIEIEIKKDQGAAKHTYRELWPAALFNSGCSPAVTSAAGSSLHPIRQRSIISPVTPLHLLDIVRSTILPAPPHLIMSFYPVFRIDTQAVPLLGSSVSRMRPSSFCISDSGPGNFVK